MGDEDKRSPSELRAHLRTASRFRAWKTFSRSFLLLSLIGLGVSLWAHLATFAGVDPASAFPGVWVFQLLLLVLVLPIIAELFRHRDPPQILRSPRWMQISLYGLLVYYGLNFYAFLYWSVDNLSSYLTWRMFSAGWLLLFGITAVYYKARLSSFSAKSNLR